ncbi:unnamed protein product, partial [Closterium sp. NIES-54]
MHSPLPPAFTRELNKNCVVNQPSPIPSRSPQDADKEMKAGVAAAGAAGMAAPTAAAATTKSGKGSAGAQGGDGKEVNGVKGVNGEKEGEEGKDGGEDGGGEREGGGDVAQGKEGEGKEGGEKGGGEKEGEEKGSEEKGGAEVPLEDLSLEERAMKFREMLKEKGVAPFSKWEKELPKLIFDARYKAIPSLPERRAIFEEFVRTRATAERKEKRSAHKAAVEALKVMLDEMEESGDLTHDSTVETLQGDGKWGSDPRLLAAALEDKDRIALLNERVVPLKRLEEERQQQRKEAAEEAFVEMLKEYRGKRYIALSSRWSKLREELKEDERYSAVEHWEDRERLFDTFMDGLQREEEEKEREARRRWEEE